SSRLLTVQKDIPSKTKGLAKRLFDGVGVLLSNLEDRYKALLHKALQHRLLTIVIAVSMLGGSLLLIPMIGSELMPEADEGEIRISLEMEAGTKLDITHAKMLEVEQLIRNSVPELNHMVLNTGGPGWRGPVSHTGNMRLSLVPLAQRTRSSEAVANDLRAKLNSIPGARIRVQPTAGLMVFRRMQAGAGRLEVIIRGHDLEGAAALARQIQAIIESTSGVTDTNLSRSSGSPEQLVVVDRQKASELGLSVEHIARMLQTVLSGTRAGYYREEGKEYPIMVQLTDDDKGSLEDVLNLTLINASGEPVVLRNAVKVISGMGATQIDRQDQERITTISANISGRDMGSIITDIREQLHSIAIPPEFAVVFGGDFEEQQRSFRELMLGFVLALILVYMVMACQYESLRDPFVVMFSVPFAIIGVVLILFITGTTFNIQSYIGMIMLGGIVVNNAILLVDTTNLLRRQDGFSVRDAIEEAGKRRLRPILMTASTTVLAMIPMAIGFGEGGEAQAPLARAVVGGMISSALITLVFVPVIYSLFEGLSNKTSKA
ncbi:MAG: efflux RND transporter permease subunit, partial [Candidatus Cloacimonadaceae bacterium]|nr:efflux RND transporter permease subunit [Candidatus Cloacimonadaceae bacterium]